MKNLTLRINNRFNLYQISFIALFFIFTNNLLGQNVVQWAAQHGAQNTVDESSTIILDTFGNIWATGFIEDPVNGDDELWIAQYNPDGTILWDTTIEGTGDERGTGLLAVNSNIYIVGTTNSVDFPVTGSGYQASFAGGGSDIFIIKLNKNRNLVSSTCYGGSGADLNPKLAVDSSDNIIITGETFSADFPTQDNGGFFQGVLGGTTDIFVCKFSSTGVRLWSSYLGGSNIDALSSFIVDRFDNIILVGETFSVDFPTQDNGGYFQGTLGGGGDAFVCQFNTANSLIWSTYYGGSGNELDLTFAVDGAGNIIIAGQTFSANFPTQDNGGYFQGTLGGTTDFFILKFDNTRNRLWSTYLGGAGNELNPKLAVDGNDNIIITGETFSADFPTTLGAFQPTFAGASDAFVSKFSNAGSLLWSTYLGGTSFDGASLLTIDGNDNIIISGTTESPDLPTSGAFQPVFAGATDDAFVSKWNPTGSLLWSSYLGGAGTETPTAMVYDDFSASLYITGTFNDTIDFSTGAVLTSNESGLNTDIFTLKIGLSCTGNSCVWPGDANNDLIANIHDILAIGLAYGTVGSVRPSASNLWIGQPALSWSDTLADGTNYMHIDCNGDGIINATDTNAILLNYGETHNKTALVNKASINDPVLFADIPEPFIPAGTVVSVPIHLGTMSIPANNVYGIAFSIDYDPNLVASLAYVNYNNSWLGTNQTNMLTLDYTLPNSGQLDIALTRIDQNNQSGYGELVEVGLVLKDDLIGKVAAQNIFKVSFSNVKVIDNNEIIIPVNLKSDSALLSTSVSEITRTMTQEVNVYPSPVNDVLYINSNDVITGIKLVSIIGQQVYISQERTNQKIQLDISSYPEGVYLLSAKTKDGNFISKRVIIQR